MFKLKYPLQEGEPGAAGGAVEPQTFSVEFVRELRRENATWRTKAADAEKRAEAAEQAAKDAETTANDKIKAAEADFTAKTAEATAAAQAKIDEAAANTKKSILHAELKAAAVKQGVVDPDAMLKIADLSKVTLKDDNTLDGADALFETLKKDKAYLFAAPTTSTTTGVKPPTPAPAPQTDAMKMTTEEYKAARQKL